MPGPKPSPVRARPGGGMNANLGNMSGEHFDESMAAQASQQKSLGLQSADPGAMPLAGQQLGGQASADAAKPAKPRPVTPQKELSWAGKDIFQGLMSLADFRQALTIDPVQDDPEKQAKKQQVFQNLQKMNQEEQAEVKRLWEEREARKRQAEEEEERRKQEQAAQAQQGTIAPPSGPKKGPQGPAGSKKQKAQTQLQQQRQSLGTVQGAN